jgi:serine/threonine protein kinase
MNLFAGADEGLYYLVLEYANQGNLREFTKKRKHSFEWIERIRIAIQIVEGIHYLHNELNIAHRDLVSNNFH